MKIFNKIYVQSELNERVLCQINNDGITDFIIRGKLEVVARDFKPLMILREIFLLLHFIGVQRLLPIYAILLLKIVVFIESSSFNPKLYLMFPHQLLF